MKFMTVLLLTFTLLFQSCSESAKTQNAVKFTQNNAVISGDTIAQLGNNIMVIYQDKKNNFWFGSWEDGLYKYNGKSLVHFTTKHGLPHNRVEEIKEDQDGNVFINTSAGLCKYDGTQFTYISDNFSSSTNWTLQPGDLWFKSTKPNHVCRYDGKTLTNLEIPKVKITNAFLTKHPNSLDNYGIYCIYKDSQGNVWLGTGFLGVMRYDGYSFDWISEPDVTEMHEGPANGVRGIAEDKDGNFWFNTEYKYSVYNKPTPTNKNSTTFYNRIKSVGYLDGNKAGFLNEYLSITKDNSGNLWIATYIHGVWKVSGDQIEHYPIQVDDKNITIFYITKDNKGDIWLATHENGAYKFDGKAFVKFAL